MISKKVRNNKKKNFNHINHYLLFVYVYIYIMIKEKVNFTGLRCDDHT